MTINNSINSFKRWHLVIHASNAGDVRLTELSVFYSLVMLCLVYYLLLCYCCSFTFCPPLLAVLLAGN